jgi:MOSC domain-containing protein YiiM
MKLLSVNVGLPRLVLHDGEPVSTGIFKQPVTGAVKLKTLNLEGDRQADLSVHGGPSKAVYAYPSEHYEYWKHELPDMELPWSMFGENFTTSGLHEAELGVGDKFRVGSAVIMATQPRLPCYKLNIKFGRPDMLRRFLASGRTGFYFAVLQEGEVAAGDEIVLLERNQDTLKIEDITRLKVHDKHNVELLRRAVSLEALSESWRDRFRRELENLTDGSGKDAQG